MSFDGSGNFKTTDGTFTGPGIFTAEKAAAQLVTAAHFDAFGDDIASGLTNCVTRDGQGQATVLNIVATVNSATGVINIGGVNFANMMGTNSVYAGGAGNFVSVLRSTGFGRSALTGTSAGNDNVAVGYAALNGTISGNQNVAVGSQASTLTTSNQQNNTAVGYFAMNNCQAANNTFVGASSNLAGTGQFNTGIGVNSGNALTTGARNLFLGQNFFVTSGSRNVQIGEQVQVPSATADGQLSIQNIIYGTGNTAIGASISTGKIGIGTTAPAYKLDVAGDVAANNIGNGFRVKEGTNAKMGVATLVGGTVVVSNTSVTANSRIFLTCQTPGGTPGFLRVSATSVGTSFTILSSSGSDTSVVGWFIVEPA